MRHRTTLLLAALLPFTSATAADAGDCPATLQLHELSCVATAQGWFHAANPATARQIAEDAALAASSFETYFGRPAPRGAVIAGEQGRAIPDDIGQALAAVGAAWQIPWLDAADRRAVQRSALERQLRASMPGADEAQLQARIDATLPSASAPPDTATDRSALRHEIGHMLLIRAFWDAPATDASRSAGHYGGPGPDWLDELAAVLMESQAMTGDRRAKLHSPEAAAHMQPLATFFDMAHPMVARMSELASRGPGAHVISGAEAQRLTGDAGWFYVQARGVADFLLDTSDDPAVFGRIAAFLADGGDMAGWLAAHGAQTGLPASITELDAVWTQWLAARAPSPEAAQAR
ncbi:hypothetical protein [Luteimonas terrae]|uniref:Peptidase MA-like domain-containing protein n=1 Tax=Luteimonas terrae TaxID=1530191 RepID=A0ABU1XZ60_9GAMM|nr:hypothetical protein [Luteimonas terrae]MDR7194059.1 hypothetical protein [Luteimonas terrae]